MTNDADFKALVRARMASTGESYTSARAALMAHPPPDAAQAVPGASPPADPFVERTVRAFFDGDRLTSIPARRRARVAVLVHLLTRFERGRTYTEPEVNDLLRAAHEDVASLRRELVDYRYLVREGGTYWVTETLPVRDANEAQEVPADEAQRLARLPVATREQDDA